jgi:hypothetical protein
VVQVRQAKEIMVALVQVLGRHLVRAAVAARVLSVETELEVSVAQVVRVLRRPFRVVQ